MTTHPLTLLGPDALDQYVGLLLDPDDAALARLLADVFDVDDFEANPDFNDLEGT